MLRTSRFQPSTSTLLFSVVLTGDFMKHHFDEWLVNNTAGDPDWAVPWPQKDPRAVARYTNFPMGRRANAKRGQVIDNTRSAPFARRQQCFLSTAA